MDLQFNEQTQYRVMDSAADSAQVSLYPVLSCDRDWFSVMPDEQKTGKGFWFTLIVKEQDLFRLNTHISLEEIFFSVSAPVSCGNGLHSASTAAPRIRKDHVRRQFTSSCAQYFAVGRIRL